MNPGYQAFLGDLNALLNDRDPADVFVLIGSPAGMEIRTNIPNVALQLGMLEMGRIAVTGHVMSQGGVMSGTDHSNASLEELLAAEMCKEKASN